MVVITQKFLKLLQHVNNSNFIIENKAIYKPYPKRIKAKKSALNP